MTNVIRIAVADDHPLFRDGLTGSLQACGDFVIVGQSADAESALRLVREQLPDILLLDVTMPGGGIEAAARISARVGLGHD